MDQVTSVSGQLADWVSSVEFNDLPADVVHAAKTHILDGAGVGLAASRRSVASDVTSAVRRITGGYGQCTVWSGEKLSAAPAAFVNGTLIHSLEFDDTHIGSVIHGTSVALPTALATGELVHASGRSMLTAFVVAWEIMVRLGAASPGGYQARGFQTTGACGPLGAAAAAGYLLDLNQEQITSAFGIAGSSAAGLMQYAVDGADSKSTHPGKAAHDGILAAAVASANVRGTQEVIEGQFGVLRSVGGLEDPSAAVAAITDQLGQEWSMPDVAFKLNACCHYAQPFLEAISVLIAQGLEPDEIEEIDCAVAPEIVSVICEPELRKQCPRSGYESRFSLPFLIALTLVYGPVLADSCTDARVSERRLLDLAARVRFHTDPNTGFPKRFGGAVQVTTRSGERLTARIDDVNGGPGRRALTVEVAEKFRANAHLVIDEDRLTKLEHLIATIEDIEDVNELSELLRRDA